MKKLLLTLCAVFAGMAAYAQGVDLSIVDASGNAVNEITAAPGDQVVMHIKATNLDGICNGAQFRFRMNDAAGNAMADDGVVSLKKTAGKYFSTEGMTTFPSNNAGQAFNTENDMSYRVIDANTEYNVMMCNDIEAIADLLGETVDVLYDDYGMTDAMFTEGNIFKFTIKIGAEWNEEFANLNFDEEWSKFAFGSVQVFAPEGALDLKIKNGNYTPSVQDLTGEIVVSEPTEDGLVTVSYNGPEDVTITVNGEEYTEPIQLVDGDNVLNVVVSAEGYNNLEETFTINWTAPVVPPEPQDLTGEIVVSEPTAEGLVTVSYNGPEDVTITVNGEEYTEPIQLVDGENVLNVVVSAEGYNNLEESFTITWTAPIVPPEPVDLQGEIVVGEPNEEGVVTIEYTGDENVTVTVTINGEPAEEPYQLVDGVNTIVVTVEGEGYNPMTETFEVEWNAPEPPEDPHMVGKWIVLIDNAGEEHWYELNVDPNGENNWSTMLTLHHNPWAENVPFYFMVDGVQMGAESDMYLPAMGNNTQTLLNPVFEGENMFYVPATYTYTFGLQLKDGQYYLLVAQGPQTAVNEINGGKAVAGVRYFNMAGQEMQEANGMTIVVTTYTDGTTSAVKVMK